MPCWRAGPRRFAAAVACAALVAGCSNGEPQAGLAITAMDGRLLAGRYTLDLELEVRLSKAVEEALHNGVPIRLLVETRVLEPRDWLWSETLVEATRGYTLSHHGLSNQYLIRSPGSEAYRAYPSRQVALSVLESPDPWQLELPPVPDGTVLTAEARVRLDLQALPAPLRLVAYFSPDWRIGSGWRRAKLAPGVDGG